MKNTLLFACFFSAAQLFAQAGLLDPSFDTDGKVVTSFTANGQAQINALVVQPDQKIVAAGYSNATNAGFAVIRYLPDGSPDMDFGVDGKSFINFGASTDLANAVALQPDGKIVLAGSAFSGSNSNFALARLKDNGEPDLEFGALGLRITPIAPTKSEAAAVAIQTDGKIVVAGTAYLDPLHGRFALARYDAQGAPDVTFGTGGIVLTDVDSLDSHAQAMALQPDGKIVVAGYARHGSKYDFALLRYLSDGSPDVSFGNNGQQLTDFTGFDDLANALVLQPDGKIVLAGTTAAGTTMKSFGLARYTADGVPDPSFGNGGKVTTNIATIPVRDVAQALLLQADGKIIAVGFTYIVSFEVNNFALARYYPDGTPDLTFNSTGEVTTAFQVGNDQAFAAALQADGRIIAAGRTAQGQFALARYLPGTVVGTGNISEPVPLIRAYPNPVQEAATVEYLLDRATTVSITLYDRMGRVISRLAQEEQRAAGLHRFPLRLPASLPAGEYLLVLTTPQGHTGWRVVK